jgi:hydroxyversicolorone monooxygenase
MAPDLNAVAGGERFDYSAPGSSGYSIDQNITYNDPSNRKLRVLTIGAGVTGILMAYRIQKDTPNVEHVIYEKNADVGHRSNGMMGQLLTHLASIDRWHVA